MVARAIDLFVTYRFIKLLTTPFNKTEAFKLGIIDAKGNRITEEGTNKPTCLLYTSPSPRDMRRSRMPSSA